MSRRKKENYATLSPSPTPYQIQLTSAFAGGGHCLDQGQWGNPWTDSNKTGQGQYLCQDNNTNQQFFKPGSTTNLVNILNGRCLTAGSTKGTYGYPLSWSSCYDTDNQKFSVIAGGSTGISLIQLPTSVTGNTPYCVDVGNPDKNYTCGDKTNVNQLFNTPVLNTNTSGMQNGNFQIIGDMQCQGASSTVCCPANQTLSAGMIKYGRWDNSTCPGAGVPAPGKAYKYIPLPASCIGQQGCNIDDSVVGTNTDDPAVGYFKQYQVSYNCTPVVTPTPTPLPPPPGLPSGAPLPTPLPSPAPGPSETKTYTIYFDVPCNTLANSTCDVLQIGPKQSGPNTYNWCNTPYGGSCGGQGGNKPSAPIPSLTTPSSNYFAAYNCSSVKGWQSTNARGAFNGNPGSNCGGNKNSSGGFSWNDYGGSGADTNENCGTGACCKDYSCKGWQGKWNCNGNDPSRNGNGSNEDNNPCWNNSKFCKNNQGGTYCHYWQASQLTLYGQYNVFKPKQSKYWFWSCNANPSTPTFLHFIVANGTVDTTDSANVSPSYAVFKVIYTIKYPSAMNPEEMNLMLTQIGASSYTAWTITKNCQTVQTLLIDYCNVYNNGLYLTTKLLSTGKTLCGTNIMTYFVNSPTTPPTGYPATEIPSSLSIPTSLLACDTTYSFETGCQTGWYNYCNQPATFTSNACQNFYSSSYKNGSLDSTVRTNLKNLCSTITMTNGVLNETIDPTIQSVCGCYLPDSVYNAFKSQVTQNNPQLASAMTQPQCYYSMCSGNPSLWPDKNIKCPDLTITQCINNVTNNLNAGGNISNVKLANNSVMNCSANSGSVPSPSPTPAAAAATTGTATSTGNSTPVAATPTSSGASTASDATTPASPATPAESPASPASTSSPASHWYDACSIM